MPAPLPVEGLCALRRHAADGLSAGTRPHSGDPGGAASRRARRHFIDTADAYGIGANEELLAEGLHPYAEGLVTATKVGHTRPSPGEWKPVGRPEYLRQAAELSLRRLKIERIDLLQLHRIDPAVPLADQLGAFGTTSAGRQGSAPRLRLKSLWSSWSKRAG